MKTTLKINDQPLSLGELRKTWEGPVRVTLGDSALARVRAAQEKVAAVLASGEQVYGVNTGFGQLAQVRISDDELEHLQKNLIRSHAVGVGPLLSDDVVRLVMIMKVKALARGHSGVRPELIDAICALINNDIYPAIPSKGSVGASGDLAPLAHLARVLIGIGSVRINGQELPAEQALISAGLEPITLAPKEGLALLNGTQVSTALALAATQSPSGWQRYSCLTCRLQAGAGPVFNSLPATSHRCLPGRITARLRCPAHRSQRRYR